MKVGLAGLGLIGGSLLRGLAGRGATVTGYDADPGVRRAAAGEGFAVADELAGLDGCDLVVVAVPPEATPDVVAAALAAAPEAVVADTASVKAPVLAAVHDLSPDRFVAAHPLAGAETAGWAASSPEIVRGAVWAVCPPEHDAPLAPLCRLAAAVELLDGRLVACTARDHDEAVARTSHVPHVAAQALAGILGNGEHALRAVLSAGGYRDMTRVARSDSALWTEILTANRAEVVAALDELVAELRWYRAALEGGDRAGLRRSWDAAREALDGLHTIRWAPVTWEERSLERATWDALLALGREGRAIRRLRLGADGALALEVAR